MKNLILILFVASLISCIQKKGDYKLSPILMKASNMRLQSFLKGYRGGIFTSKVKSPMVNMLKHHYMEPKKINFAVYFSNN